MLVMKLRRQELIEHLAFSPDGRALAAACVGGAHLWREIADGSRAAWLGYFSCNHVGFTPDGRWLFSGPFSLWRFDLEAGDGATLRPWDGYSTPFDVSPTAPHVLLSQYLSTGADHRTRLALWRADDLSPAGKLWEREATGHTYLPPQFLPGGRRFARLESQFDRATNRWGLHVHYHDAATGDHLNTTALQAFAGSEAAFSPDAQLLAMRETTQIYLRRLDAPGSVIELRNTSKKFFTAIAFHPSGKYLAVTSNDETVKLYDVATGREVRTLTWQIGRMRSVAFSPDGSVAAAGSDKGRVVLWDVDL